MSEGQVTDFDQLLRDARARLGTAPVAGDSAPGEPGDDPEGQGEAPDGRVRAVAACGRLQSLELSPRLMRLPASELADHVTGAVNAALDDLRVKAPAAEDAAVDPGALARTLRDVRHEGVRAMTMITQGLATAMSRISRRAYVAGDPGTQGIEYLLEHALQTLTAVHGAVPPAAEEEEHGTGEAADGQIRATVSPGVRVGTIEIAERAMRKASQELAGHIAAAVNDAIDDVRSRSAEFVTGDPTELRERLRQAQDMSIAHMRAYTQSLQAVMSGIQRR